MTAEIFTFDGITTLDLPPDRILESAMGKLQSALVVGFDNDGELYVASSCGKTGTNLLLLELGKKRIVDIVSGGGIDSCE